MICQVGYGNLEKQKNEFDIISVSSLQIISSLHGPQSALIGIPTTPFFTELILEFAREINLLYKPARSL